MSTAQRSRKTRRIQKIFTAALPFVAMTGINVTFSPSVNAATEWSTLRDAKLESSPIDIAQTADGSTIYILTEKEILVYSMLENKTTNRIPVDKPYDKLRFVDSTKTLILSSGAEKELRMIQVEEVYDIDVKNRPRKGPADAAVTIVVFDDYQCPFCAKLEPQLEEVLKKFPQDASLVIKQFPLNMHKFADPAARAAFAASKQGKFWEFHSKQFESFQSLDAAKIKEAAKSVGLDMKKFEADMESAEIKAMVEQDLAHGRLAGVNGTPSLFVNGRRANPRNLEQMIDRLVSAQKAAQGAKKSN